jgi:hypothetical protein
VRGARRDLGLGYGRRRRRRRREGGDRPTGVGINPESGECRWRLVFASIQVVDGRRLGKAKPGAGAGRRREREEGGETGDRSPSTSCGHQIPYCLRFRFRFRFPLPFPFPFPTLNTPNFICPRKSASLSLSPQNPFLHVRLSLSLFLRPADCTNRSTLSYRQQRKMQSTKFKLFSPPPNLKLRGGLFAGSHMLGTHP